MSAKTQNKEVNALLHDSLFCLTMMTIGVTKKIFIKHYRNNCYTNTRIHLYTASRIL